MKLSDLMQLTQWQGQIHISLRNNPVQLSVTEDNRLMFRAAGTSYYIEDQEVNPSFDGSMWIHVKAKNRMARALPAHNKIFLLDTQGQFIRGEAITMGSSQTPLHGYYGNAHRNLMA